MKTISLLLIACLFTSTISQTTQPAAGAGDTQTQQAQGGAGAPT